MSMDNYSIVVVEMYSSGRALMDLRHRQFFEGQTYGILGSLAAEYPNRITDQTRLLRGMRFNKEI